MLTNITKEEFSKKVENRVANKKTTYLETIIDLQEEYGLDYSLIAKLLSQPLIEKLECEGRNINLIKRSKNTLPFA
jgi:hypothetical protein